MEPLVRAAYRTRRHVVPPSAVARRAYAERAIDRYLAWCDGYVDSLTRKSEYEAQLYSVAGEAVVPLRAPVAHVTGDATHQRLRHYQAWLDYLRGQGLYNGPLTLKRLRPEGGWEPIDLDHP